jgi:hypothetical protein
VDPELHRETIGNGFSGLFASYITPTDGEVLLADRVNKIYKTINTRQLMLQIVDLDARW